MAITFEFPGDNMSICPNCEEFPVSYVVTENHKRQCLCDRCYNELFERCELDEEQVDEKIRCSRTNYS